MRFKIYRSEEEDLIHRCRKGDQKAQKEIYERYAQKMYGVCVRYIKEYDQAEDVMVIAFQKIFERIDQFNGDGSFEGWIRRIMVNESLTWLRKNRNMQLEVDIDQADRYPNYDSISKNLEAEDLLKLIQELPVGYRTVFNLFAIEGYSHKEIADQLNMTENNSRSQLSRARALLQKKLADMETTFKEKIT